MFQNLKNESGMVLIMVLLVTIIIMVYSIGILSRGASQVVSAEDEVDRIKAEQLVIGAYAKTYSDLAAGSSAPASFSATLDNKTFLVSVTSSNATGPGNTNTLVFNSAVSN